MKRYFFGFLVFWVFFLLIYGLFLNRHEIRILPPELVPRNPPGFYDYSGVIHVQSHLSTGNSDIQSIVRAAQRSNLDFLFITDLNTYERPLELSGYHNQLLVFLDGKFSYLNSRLLNLDVSTMDHLTGVGRAQVVLTDLLNQTHRSQQYGIFVLAHPLKHRFQWTGEFPPGLDGIEVINLRHLWQQAWLNHRSSFFWTLFVYPFNDRLALLRIFRHPRQEFLLWDRLTQQRPTLGFSGADAGAKIRAGRRFQLGFPSYETLFNISRTHVLLRSELTGHAAGDRQKISTALRNGNFFISLDSLANPKGFNALLIDRQGRSHPMGSSINFSDGLKIRIQLPQKPLVPFDVQLFRDGEHIMTSNSVETEVAIHKPGVYRIQVQVRPSLPLPDGPRWFPWIYTNPFYVLRESEQ